MGRYLLWLAVCLSLASRQLEAFAPPSPPISSGWTTTIARSKSPEPMARHMAGFGASDADKSTKKEPKLKPKAQWDRYTDLKGEPMIRVAVMCVTSEGGEDDNEWLEVGRVRSKENASTEAAVARQRALIADHARRLFPLQVTVKDTLQWAYWQEEQEEWKLVDPKKVVAEKGVEKLIGFEGRPDPATGFYCHYDAGRLVDSEKSVNQGPSQ